MNTSELFVQCLQKEGVRRVHGVPGEENAAFMIALEDAGVPFILTRHEQGAAFMAEVQGRLTGQAGVCLATLGPGAANLVTGVGNGNMDRAPMVVITGQADSRRQHKESHQVMNVVDMFTPITKWATPVTQPENVPEIVRKAFKIATTEKPGACLIELAEDIAREPVEGEPLEPRPLRRPVADASILGQALQAIRGAKRPIVLAGNGAIRRRASKQLRRFAEATGIGVASTFMAKGCVDRHSPRCLFTIGLQARDHVACAFDAADLVIAIGYDMVEYPPRLWNSGADKTIVHIDFAPAEVDHCYDVDVEVVGDPAHSLWWLTEEFAKGPAPTFDLSSNETVRGAMLEDFARHAEDDTDGLIRPQKVLWDLREVLAPEDVLLSDVGAHKMWVARYYHCDEPNTCLIPNGFCSMGFALPGALSAAMVHPDRNVVAVCGDGGFLMNVQEMETARRLNSDVTVVIWEDGEYGLIAWKQQNEYGRHTDLAFGNPDFVKLAGSFGWDAHRVTRSRELRGVLKQAIATRGPSLVVVPIDYRENDLLTRRLGDIACPL